MREVRVDPHLGTVVHIVSGRQNRPNLPTEGCPFCIGGLEAPTEYQVKSFPNRWPALNEGYCEVVLYTPQHEATFASLDVDEIVDVIDIWAERTAALHALPHGEYVVIFENRGHEIGATIPHPHGQIYAFDHVPSRPRRQLEARWTPHDSPEQRLVFENDDWIAYTEFASVHPLSLRIATKKQTADISSLSAETRASLADTLKKILTACDAVFEAPLPYMMWINQAPRNTSQWPSAWLNIEIVSPWRRAGLPRYIAAVEIATEEFFNPVDPSDIASRLRDLIS